MKQPRKRLKTRDANLETVKDLMDEFKEEKKADGRSKQTLESYNNSFAKFLTYIGEDLTIDNFSEDTIYQYKGHLVKEMENEALALASVNHYLRDLRTFVNWLYDKTFISQKVKLTLVKGQEKQIETYTEEEIEKLIKRPDRNASWVEWRSWAIDCFILGTGCRIETVVNVTIGDIRFGRGEIAIRAQKSKKVGYVPMDRTLSNHLKKFISKCRAEATDNAWLFCNIYEEQLTTKALQSAMWDYHHKRGVNKTSPHALRHTFAKLYIMNGGDTFRLQKILGHSTLEMTRHYVNLFSGDLKKDYDDFSPLNTMARKMGAKERKVKKTDDD